MEATSLQAFLRVLYTVNSNPQYILAKSSSKVSAIPCNETTAQSTNNEPSYARTPLKACLAVVCDSSPELLQDLTRDFSLYVLDPLEAQPPPTGLAPAHRDSNSPRGVAVALGLMSWALESNDAANIFVTGTILPHASPSLEVVFALRETKRMPKPMFHSYPTLGSMSMPGPSQSHHPYPPYPPQVAGMNWLPVSQGQRTLTRSADFPELYIGPPRRGRGRPEGSTLSKSKVASQGGTSSHPGETPSDVTEAPSESKRNPGRNTKRKSKSRPSRATPTVSPFICAPLTRHTSTGGPVADVVSGVSALQPQSHRLDQPQMPSHAGLYPQARPYVHPTPSPLPSLLPAIPSTLSGNIVGNLTPEQQAALLSALQGLLVANPQLLQLAATNLGPSTDITTNGEQSTDHKPAHKGDGHANGERENGDSDIVILDSSTVDATAFRKPSTWQLGTNDQDVSSPVTNGESPVSSNHGTDSSPLPASTPPSGQENTPESSEISTPTATLVSTPTVTPDAETPRGRGNVSASHTLDAPATPTPSRTRKRKLSEYAQGQAYSSTRLSPPSPSPSVGRQSDSGRRFAARRIQSSPTNGRMSGLPSSARLPSMLGSMRTLATSGFRLSNGSSSSSTNGGQSSNKSTSHTSTLVSNPSESKTDIPATTDALTNAITSDTTLKRRRTLNEFMAEHEARRNTKVRKRTSSGRKTEIDVSASASRAALPQSVKPLPMPKNTQSSPPRPLFRSDSVTSSLPAPAYQPAFASGTVITNPAWSSVTTLTCTAPSASVPTTAPMENPLKNFVTPAWARTSTAMLPRLSDEALARQQAEREAKKVQVSLRRREAAKAKRKGLLSGEHHSKESSDEDDDTIANGAKPQTRHLSSPSAARLPPLPAPLPTLPVFASDVVEPIPSSPPRSHRPLMSPVTPSTPPRKSASSGSAPYRTPAKLGSCSLFTPSGQDTGSLFTPSTPNVTPSLTRASFTPRSPTVLHRSSTKKSPRKSMIPQTPWTPRRSSSGNNQTPRGLRTGKHALFASPSLVARTPQTQTRVGMGTRAFLLPPPSPSALRTPKQMGSETVKQPSLSAKSRIELDKDCKEKEVPSYGPRDALFGKDAETHLSAQSSPGYPVANDGQGTDELRDTPQAEEECVSSPLPPSSPLPTSPLSSPAQHDLQLAVSGSDTFPPASDAVADMDLWPSDGACPASWLSETSAWLTETEAWLTDTEGGPLLTDSDTAWLSDSDAVFGDISSFPASAANWLSDDVDMDTDRECSAMAVNVEKGGEFDTGALERAFATLVNREGRDANKDKGEDKGVGNKHGHGHEGGDEHDDGKGKGGPGTVAAVDAGFWTSMQPLLGGSTGNGGTESSQAVDEDKIACDIRELLDGLVGT